MNEIALLLLAKIFAIFNIVQWTASAHSYYRMDLFLERNPWKRQVFYMFLIGIWIAVLLIPWSTDAR